MEALNNSYYATLIHILNLLNPCAYKVPPSTSAIYERWIEGYRNLVGHRGFIVMKIESEAEVIAGTF